MPEIDVLFAGVAVADLDAGVDWYSRLMGRRYDIDVNPDEKMWQCSPGGWLYLIRDADRAGSALVTLAVADLASVVDDLASRGVTGSGIEAVGDAGHKASYTDPDGNVVAMIQVNAAPAA